jgi:hypothetical protein
MPHTNAKADEEHYLFVIRYMQFHNVWTVYFDLLSGKYEPSVQGYQLIELEEPGESFRANMQITFMFLLYGMFYSLVEEAKDELNAFRIWKLKYPEEEEAISELEYLVSVFVSDLRVFRNRLGFHGSPSRSHQMKGYTLFNNHSGKMIVEVMTQFKQMNAALIMKDLVREDIVPAGVEPNKPSIEEIRRACAAIKQEFGL